MIQVKDLNAEGPFIVHRRPPFAEDDCYIMESATSREPKEFPDAATAERFLRAYVVGDADLQRYTWTIMPKAMMPEPVELPPACPTCGAPAASISVGTKTTIPEEMDDETVGPLPGTETVECREGHYYVVRGGEAFPSGAPPHIAVKKGRY